MKAIALNGTLKKSGGEPSSTDKMLELILGFLRNEGVVGETIRLADYRIEPGVKSDEGNGDEWPGIRKRILDADILILGTPIWLGQPSSVAKRALERMDAFLSEKDDGGRMAPYGRVAAVAVVGNEDGAHHVSAELYQALNDVGFTLAPNAVSYWVGEAMQGKDFKDLDKVPEAVISAAKMLARNTAHLARILRAEGFPAVT
ncbi:MAG: NADPH-dependent oxidoreductase [Parvibaculum sp.]|jgi:multimeric flavodoxin WrbA|uniref:flavodoxin family protein n=1 Tax=Parvibaculum sp. TaxID=2024848 RepID=UPI000C3F0556|nr:flavodoxin family protein [Parvibaculum sp.]MAU60224.1 NADPH-dependent oxidoreductase [Parvibaculum sp.]|tara:strand:- start:4178 stop:4783 length:606 start_codon:yes stop_codon:yes gene_type:complete